MLWTMISPSYHPHTKWKCQGLNSPRRLEITYYPFSLLSMIPTLGTTTQSSPWLIYQYPPQPTRCYIHILCHAPISHELTLRVVNLLLLLCRTYSIFYHKTLYFTQKHSLYLSPSTIVWSTQTAQPPTAITLHPRCPHFILQQPNFSPILSRNPPTTHRIFFDYHNSYPLSLPMHDSSIATDFCIYNERTTTKPSSYHYLPLTTPFITLLSHNNSPPLIYDRTYHWTLLRRDKLF